MTVRRDWSEARQKVDEEGRCRVCLRGDKKLEAAHILGRRYDRPRVEGSTTKVLLVHRLSVIPMCSECHYAYDSHRLSILKYLTPEEQVRAVQDAGTIELARRRLDPLDYTPEIQKARAGGVTFVDEPHGGRL